MVSPHQGSSPLRESALDALVGRYRPAVESALRKAFDGSAAQPYGLMRYHLGWEDQHGKVVESRGGKLLRPALCLLCCDAAGGDWQQALPAAAALELLHNFTLIHDDVEDASKHRHGRETLWSLSGDALAINAGDGMFALAHLTLLRLLDQGHAPERVLQAFQMLDTAALRLCEGQHQDLAYAEQAGINKSDYLTMVEGKTAVLLAASTGIGALLAGAPSETIDALSEFGRRLGLAFQIRDDALGIWGDPQETGKPAGDDLRAGKKSFPVVVALERAAANERETLLALLADDDLDDAGVQRGSALLERLGAREESDRAASDHADAAIDCLARLPLHAERLIELEQLARFAVERTA